VVHIETDTEDEFLERFLKTFADRNGNKKCCFLLLRVRAPVMFKRAPVMLVSAPVMLVLAPVLLVRAPVMLFRASVMLV
jgi:hypothetical protein